jgi:hypothetical protein
VLSKVRNWASRVAAKRQQEKLDVYKPTERLLYSYFDGTKMVKADPLVLYKKMMDIGPELSINIKISSSPMKEAGKAYADMVEQIRGIFGIKILEEGGLTELETAALLDHFLVYCDTVKKNSRFSPISSTSSEAAPVSSVDDQPTPSFSDSGSTASAPITAAPPSWPQEPASPSAPSNLP